MPLINHAGNRNKMLMNISNSEKKFHLRICKCLSLHTVLNLCYSYCKIKHLLTVLCHNEQLVTSTNDKYENHKPHWA